MKLGCGILFAIFAVLIGIGVVLNVMNGDDTVRMIGSIEVSDSAACLDPQVEIRPAEHATRTLRFDVTSWRPGQPCTLRFTKELPYVDTYRIEVPGVGVETVKRSMIDTVDADGQTRLSVTSLERFRACQSAGTARTRRSETLASSVNDVE